MRIHRHYYPSFSNSSPNSLASSTPPPPIYFLLFLCLYLSVYSNFSVIPLSFLHLPPAASVYVRLRFVYKFQFNSLRAQSYHAIFHNYILGFTSFVGVVSCLNYYRPYSLNLEPKQTPQWQLCLFRQLLEEEIYYLKPSMKFLPAIIKSFSPHYQNLLKTSRGKLTPSIYLLPSFLASEALPAKHREQGCPRRMSSLSPVVKLCTFSVFLLLRPIYKRIC